METKFCAPLTPPKKREEKEKPKTKKRKLNFETGNGKKRKKYWPKIAIAMEEKTHHKKVKIQTPTKPNSNRKRRKTPTTPKPSIPEIDCLSTTRRFGLNFPQKRTRASRRRRTRLCVILWWNGPLQDDVRKWARKNPRGPRKRAKRFKILKTYARRIKRLKIVKTYVRRSKKPKQDFSPQSQEIGEKGITEVLLPVTHCSGRFVASSDYAWFKRSLYVTVRRLKSLHISDQGGGQLVVHAQKSRKPRPAQVFLDSESIRVWNLLITNGENGESGNVEDESEEKRKWWEHQRQLFRGRADSFISRMHLILGNRRFSPWKGSVVDSVVGVYLTQNVSDFLSSSAFMCLVSEFPCQNTNRKRSHDEGEVRNSSTNDQDVNANISVTEILSTEDGDSNVNDHPRNETTEVPSRRKRGKVEEEPAEPIDWDALRVTYSKDRGRERSRDTMDAVDWEAVRHAKVGKIANTIKDRGQQNVIAQRIQNFLNRVVKDHGSLDLEWIRDVPPEKTKDYLMSIAGLGLKSVECIRLLALQHHAFPVDTNVGRIAVRLGWVPLKPLPDNLLFHLLEEYPIMNEIQKYLWPRLCTLDQRTLYELHYQMITFGKVFCTKRSPKCDACPMKGECRHYASQQSSARYALPASRARGRSMVSTTGPAAFGQNPQGAAQVQTPMHPLTHNLPGPSYQSRRGEPIIEHELPGPSYQSRNCEPIIEYPPSPESKRAELDLQDIEDYCPSPSPPKDETNTLTLYSRKPEGNSSQDYASTNNNNNTEFVREDISRAVVVLHPEAASRSAPKMKYVSRLRTVHQVYELPDSHPLLTNLDKREPDDPCQYLLAIWTEAKDQRDISKKLELSTEFADFDQQFETVKGSLLIPCRTATRGKFPLNGTYFQVNEVFADEETMHQPISVPRTLIWNLQRRLVFCGTSIQTICRGLSITDIHNCFWRGYICVRAFDRKTRAPRPLGNKFHLAPKETAKMKKQAFFDD